MDGPINVKSHNNSSKWQMRFNSAFKGLKTALWLRSAFMGAIYIENNPRLFI
jgi:hypothetical protein